MTRSTYDVLGRLTKRIDDANAIDPASRTTTWTYDTAARGTSGSLAKGKLASVAMPNYTANFSYNNVLNSSAVQEIIEGSTYLTQTSYDTASRPLTVTYPSGIGARSSYNAFGYESGAFNPVNSQSYWSTNTADERGNATTVTLGNGVVVNKVYDPERGWIRSITAQKPGGPQLQNLTYDFDAVGNLFKRADGEFTGNSLIETAVYDGLNRVLSSSVVKSGTGAFSATTTVSYDSLGNILTKSDVGAYAYAGGTCGGGIHAVKSVSGSKTASYC